jgi:hypothetical protein
MKKITYLAIIITLTSATTNRCSAWSDIKTKLSDWYNNKLQEDTNFTNYEEPEDIDRALTEDIIAANKERQKLNQEYKNTRNLGNRSSRPIEGEKAANFNIKWAEKNIEDLTKEIQKNKKMVEELFSNKYYTDKAPHHIENVIGAISRQEKELENNQKRLEEAKKEKAFWQPLVQYQEERLANYKKITDEMNARTQKENEEADALFFSLFKKRPSTDNQFIENEEIINDSYNTDPYYD